MICLRHREGATYHDDAGWPLCQACLDEALAVAEAKALERRIAALRYRSADALMRRLAGR